MEYRFPQEAIDKLKGYGMRVFMRNRDDSYAVFTPGYTDTGNVGYIQWRPMEGFTISTTHVANKTSGTGFQVARHVDDFDRRMIDHALISITPAWFARRHPENVPPVKYLSIDSYRAASAFNAAYEEV